jgi:hypothetical protein
MSGYDFSFAVGCRRPLGVNINKLILELPYRVTSHAGPHYDAVALFVKPLFTDRFTWSADASLTTRSYWVTLGDYGLMPRVSSASDQVRSDILRQMFLEWDARKSNTYSIAKCGKPMPTMKGCGDLNMTPAFKRDDDRLIAERGLRWVTLEIVSAHIDGDILDYLWDQKLCAPYGATTHDGDTCRESGSDLDHLPFTYGLSPGSLQLHPAIFQSKFVRDADHWASAICSLTASAMKVAAFDLQAARSAPMLWYTMERVQRNEILNMVSLLWRMLMVVTAWAADLILTRDTTQRPRSGT